MKKKLIRLTESDLHNIIRESVNKVLKEDNDRDFGQFGYDQPSLEDMEKESIIDCTFLIRQNKLIPKPSGSVIGNDIPDNEWCSIQVKPQFEEEKDGLYIVDLDWEYVEQPQFELKLRKNIDNAIKNQFDEICQAIYNNSPYC